MRRQCHVHKAYRLGNPEANRIPRSNCMICWEVHFEQCKEYLTRYGYSFDYMMIGLPSETSKPAQEQPQVPEMTKQEAPEPEKTMVPTPDGGFEEQPAQYTVPKDSLSQKEIEQLNSHPGKVEKVPEVGSDEWLKQALGR